MDKPRYMLKPIWELPKGDPLKPAVEKYGVESLYGMIILNGYRCRRCGSPSVIRLVRYLSGRVYTLCHECRKNYPVEKYMPTYDWTYEQLRDRDIKSQQEIMKGVRL